MIYATHSVFMFLAYWNCIRGRTLEMTLFCDTYNVFFYVSYILFCAEFKSDECQLEKFEHFCKFTAKGQSQDQL